MRSEPRVVIITNASTEIGHAAAMGFAARGDQIIASMPYLDSNGPWSGFRHRTTDVRDSFRQMAP